MLKTLYRGADFEGEEKEEEEIERELGEEEEALAAAAVSKLQEAEEYHYLKKQWLVQWIEELKDRLPPFQVKDMGLGEDEWAANISDDGLDHVLQQLPAHEMQRLECMFARTSGIVDTLSTAMDLDLMEHQVKAAQESHKDRSSAYVRSSLDRDAEEKRARDLSKPWQLIMSRFDKETGAALTIQRAYRAFAQRCKDVEYWPSDENPLHWKHWVEFRRQHGWGKAEMFDAKGNKIKRVQPKAEGRVRARYLDAKKDKRTQLSIAQDFEARTALRNFARAQRMAEILQAKTAKSQEFDAKRMEMKEKEQARMRAIQARHRAKFSGVDMRSALLDPVQRRALISQSVQELNAGRTLTQPQYRDIKCAQSFAARVNPPSHLSDLMQHFSAIHMYRKKLEIAHRRGMAAPPLPEGADADIIALYEEVMASLTQQYKEDLEVSYLERRTPVSPPDGVHDSAVVLYNQIMQRFKRLETGYDSDDAQPGKPRVRTMTNYGKAWLSAFEQSSRQRKRLLRVRSQGVLGIHQASMTPLVSREQPATAASLLAFKAIKDTSDARLQHDLDAPSSSSSPLTAMQTTPNLKVLGCPPCNSSAPSEGYPGYPPPDDLVPLPPLPPRKSDVETYQALSVDAARKLAASVACCKLRLRRPLQLQETSELCGSSWFGLDSIVEGQCSPYACNDLFLITSILRTEWLAPAEKAARTSAASGYYSKQASDSSRWGLNEDNSGDESVGTRGLQVTGRRTMTGRQSTLGAESFAPRRSHRPTFHSLADTKSQFGGSRRGLLSRFSEQNPRFTPCSVSMNRRQSVRLSTLGNFQIPPPVVEGEPLAAVQEGVPDLLPAAGNQQIPHTPGGVAELRRMRTQHSRRHTMVEGLSLWREQGSAVEHSRHAHLGILHGHRFGISTSPRALRRNSSDGMVLHSSGQKPFPPFGNPAHLFNPTTKPKSMDFKTCATFVRVLLKESGFAGLNAREILERASTILHTPRALLDWQTPRPLSACSVGQANAQLALAQQQLAVRACSQWATNTDAVLEKGPIDPAPVKGAANINGVNNQAPVPMKGRKIAPGILMKLRTPNPSVPDGADESGEVGPWEISGDAGVNPHTNSSNANSPSAARVTSGAAAGPRGSVTNVPNVSPSARRTSMLSVTSSSREAEPSVRGAADLTRACSSSSSSSSNAGVSLPAGRVSVLNIAPSAKDAEPSSRGTPDLARSSSINTSIASPPARRATTLNLVPVPKEGGSPTDGRFSEAAGAEQGSTCVAPCVTWPLMQHAWALSGLPRVHRAQSARKQAGEKLPFRQPAYSKQQVSTLGVLGRVMADAFLQYYQSLCTQAQEQPVRSFPRIQTFLDRNNLLTTRRREEDLLGGGLLRNFSKALGHTLPEEEGTQEPKPRASPGRSSPSFIYREGMNQLKDGGKNLRQSVLVKEASLEHLEEVGRRPSASSRSGSLLWPIQDPPDPSTSAFDAIIEGKRVSSAEPSINQDSSLNREASGLLGETPNQQVDDAHQSSDSQSEQGSSSTPDWKHSLDASATAIDYQMLSMSGVNVAHVSPFVQRDASAQAVQQMNAQNVPSALRCGTGFLTKKPRKWFHERAPLARSEQGTFLQQMHRHKEREQQQRHQLLHQNKQQEEGVERGKQLYDKDAAVRGPNSRNQAAKWHLPVKGNKSLWVLPESNLSNNRGHESWKALPGGGFSPLKGKALVALPFSDDAPYASQMNTLSPRQDYSRSRQCPHSTASSMFVSASNKPTGSKWGYPSSRPRKPSSALTRSSPMPLAFVARSPSTAAAREDGSDTDNPYNRRPVSLARHPYLYAENRVLWRGEGQHLTPQQHVQQHQLQQRRLRVSPHGNQAVLQAQQQRDLDNRFSVPDQDSDLLDFDDAVEGEEEGEWVSVAGRQQWWSRHKKLWQKGDSDGLLLIGGRLQTWTQQDKGQQARERFSAQEQRRQEQEERLQQERAQEHERQLLKVVRLEQQQVSRDLLAHEALAKHQHYTLKPIKPINFEGPFRKLSETSGKDWQGSMQVWQDVYAQQQLHMQEHGLPQSYGLHELYGLDPHHPQQQHLQAQHQGTQHWYTLQPGLQQQIFQLSFDFQQQQQQKHGLEHQGLRQISSQVHQHFEQQPQQQQPVQEGAATTYVPGGVPAHFHGVPHKFSTLPLHSPHFATGAMSPRSAPLLPSVSKDKNVPKSGAAFEANKAAAAVVIAADGSLASASQAAAAAAATEAAAAPEAAASQVGSQYPGSLNTRGQISFAAGVAAPSTPLPSGLPAAARARAAGAGVPCQEYLGHGVLEAGGACVNVHGPATDAHRPLTAGPATRRHAVSDVSSLPRSVPLITPLAIPHPTYTPHTASTVQSSAGHLDSTAGAAAFPHAISLSHMPAYQMQNSREGGMRTSVPSVVPSFTHAHLTKPAMDWDGLIARDAEPHLPSWMRRLVARTVAAGLTAYTFGSNRRPRLEHKNASTMLPPDVDMHAAVHVTRPPTISVATPCVHDSHHAASEKQRLEQVPQEAVLGVGGTSWAEQHFGPLFYQGSQLPTPLGSISKPSSPATVVEDAITVASAAGRGAFAPAAGVAASDWYPTPIGTPPLPADAARKKSCTSSALPTPPVTVLALVTPGAVDAARNNCATTALSPTTPDTAPTSPSMTATRTNSLPAASAFPPSAPKTAQSTRQAKTLGRVHIAPRVPVNAVWERYNAPPLSEGAARGRTSSPIHGIPCKEGLTGVVTVPRPKHVATPAQPMPPLELKEFWACDAREVVTPFGKMRTMTPASPNIDTRRASSFGTPHLERS